jgi:Ca2+/Na+ antiporter
MPNDRPQAITILAYVVVIAVVFGVVWAALTIYHGIPSPIQDMLVHNYLLVVVFPSWAILSFALLLAFKEATKSEFDLEIWAIKFKGGGGLAMVWALMTFMGWIILGHYWK